MAKKLSKNELDKLSFEDTIAKLEGIVDRIESGQTPLEESLEQYETGMKMIAHCREILQKCEEKIEMISKSSSSEKNQEETDENTEETEESELF